jgi:CHAT domain-containing protein/tetratricopeptide (TPR) repeat protein
MGKGARIRAERRESASPFKGEPDIQNLVEAVEQVADAEAFVSLVERRPSLFGEEMARYLRAIAANEEVAAFVSVFVRLVDGARTEPAEAWAEFQNAMTEFDERGRELQPEVEEIAELLESGNHDEAIAYGEEVLTRALGLGQGFTVAVVHEHLATAYRLRRSGDVGENIDKAIENIRGAIAGTPDLELRAPKLMNLAVLFSLRKNGDPAENFEQGVAVLREALEQLKGSELRDLRATVQMNLARTLQVRERGDHLENLREARDLCIQSLQWRSLGRDPSDWAHSKINLGGIYNDLVRLGEADIAEAEGELQEVIDAGDRVNESWLIGFAHASLGAVHREAAARLAEAEDREVIGPGTPPPPSEAEAKRLAAARINLEAALTMLDRDVNRDVFGRTLGDLAKVHDAAGEEEQAITAYRRALELLGPRSSPRECLHAAGRLGHILAMREEWSESAAAFSTAMSAAEFGFHARLETADRASEIQRVGNLARWSAFALARSGDNEGAVLALENGRTRELRRRLGAGIEEGQLEELPADALADYKEALEQLSGASLGPDSDGAGRRLQEVLSAIRVLPGFENFATGASLPDIAAAVEPDWPLIYLDPTPYGTLILSVIDRGGELTFEADFLDTPSSHDVLMALMLGDFQEQSQPTSFLAATSSRPRDEEHFHRALKYLTLTLGEWVGRPLASRLKDLAVPGATLVPCGPISLAPLHALRWQTGEDSVCLLDLLDLRDAASATLQAACIDRVREREGAEQTLVAIGNPDLGDPEGDLPAADAEVKEIVRHFAPKQARCATRDAATAEFLAAAAPAATHVHLACHGESSMFPEEEAKVFLADAELSAPELVTLGLGARLTVISACETAVFGIAHLPDEAFSLGTAFLAAGSAGAIATLWSIDDVATAMLMTRFYEEMFERGLAPAGALRSAQLWLRDLKQDDEAAFLAEHPALEAEYRRRCEQGRRPGRRGGLENSPAASSRPYSAPEFWAPFVAFGA